ncbi:MAG: hypothetical protein MUC83_19295, partial [Pirellula sp.]|nr:hypothetical protein [Pirellula sp.]
MARNSLVMMLLLGIAYSQILGGITCCCLVGSISVRIAILKNGLESDPSSCAASDPDVVENLTRFRCPRCAARSNIRTSDTGDIASKDSTKSKGVPEIVAPCSCSKFYFVGNECKESPTPKFKTGGADWVTPLVNNHSACQLQVNNQYSSPPLLL